MSSFNIRDAATVHLSWGIYPRNLQKEELFQSQITANTYYSCFEKLLLNSTKLQTITCLQSYHSVYLLSYRELRKAEEHLQQAEWQV